jgi:hypothetical protein
MNEQEESRCPQEAQEGSGAEKSKAACTACGKEVVKHQEGDRKVTFLR